MLSRVEYDMCQYFEQQEFFRRFGRWAQLTDGVTVIADVIILAGFLDRGDYRFVPYFIRPVGIEDSEIVAGTMCELLVVDGAYPVWSDGCGQFGQSDRFFCVGMRERRRSC